MISCTLLNTIKRIILCFSLMLLCISCAKTVNNSVEIYDNDFESGNLSGITHGTLSPYNGSVVLGNYNNGQFSLTVQNIPSHNIIDISFDLYIHDNWVGVQQRETNSGPDVWQMKVDDKFYVNTTFNNYACADGNFCPPQSYPADYPNQSYNPRSGSSQTGLPGFCDSNSQNGTTLYKIHKSISHSDNTIIIQCLDLLKSKGALDPKCDESWSIDNIKIRAINLN